jgi:thiol-disulfide isomerase/thioredoxin
VLRSPLQLAAAAGIAVIIGVVLVTTLGRGEASVEPVVAADIDDAGAPAAGDIDNSDADPADPPASTPPEPIEVPDLGPMPDIENISGWLNTAGSSFEEVRGPVTIVQFWTFGCSNCRATLPHLQELYAARHADGLEIIGIHAHEFERERDPANVAQAVIDLGVTWPVALDTDKTNFVAWQGSPRFWPRTYVIDAEGRIRFDHIGEGAYDELAATVDALLAEHDAEDPETA